MREPKDAIRNLLKEKWVNTNISGTVTPKFSTGWWDDRNDLPQVTLTNSDETPNPNTETGQTQVVGSGTLKQNISGVADLNCWANRDSATYPSGTAVNPKLLVDDMKQECRRIIQSNVDVSATSPVDLTELNYIGWGGAMDRVDSDVTPAVYRKLCEVNYGYID